MIENAKISAHPGGLIGQATVLLQHSSEGAGGVCGKGIAILDSYTCIISIYKVEPISSRK